MLQEAPEGKRLPAILKRISKIVLAALAHASGLTGPLLRRLLRSKSSAIVLGYHGVCREAGGLFDSGHAVANVSALLRYLSRHLRPLPLEALAGPVARGEAPPPASFAVTFDDGLVNNVTLAIPMLKALGLPATFFVPSGLVGSPRDLWVASLREVIRTWPGDFLPPEPGLWPALPLQGEGTRYTALHRIKKVLKAHEGRREEVLARLCRKSGVISPLPEEDRVVGPELLPELVQPGLSVGAHSRSHPILSGLDPERAREEIAGSRQDLERLLGTKVRDFAYPNGGFADFNETTRRLVAEAGFRCALTTEPGTVRAGDDALALRRCMPENVPAFLASFDLLIRAWKDRRRPADGTLPLERRVSFLGRVAAEAGV